MDRMDIEKTFGTGAFTRMFTPSFARIAWLVTLAMCLLWALAAIFILASGVGSGTIAAARVFDFLKTLAEIVVVAMLVRGFIEVALSVAERNRAQ